MVFAFLVCLVLPTLTMCQPGGVGKSISYKNCGAEDVIKSVDLSPCPSEPCQFKRGVNVTVTINFLAKAVAPAVTAKVYGIVAGVPVPYPLPKPDGCRDCNLTCPLQPGEHMYQNVFPVLSTYPEIRLAVKWELVDGQENQLVCFEFPMSIVG